jgi:hypothetical protein
MSNTNSVAKAPIFNASDVGSQAQGFVTASLAWVQAYWLQILIAFGAGALIVLALHTARRFGSRLCERPRGMRRRLFRRTGRGRDHGQLPLHRRRGVSGRGLGARDHPRRDRAPHPVRTLFG